MRMNEFDKCNFCREKYTFDGCDWCENKNRYKPDPEKILEKAKERGISCSDVIALIKYTSD